MALILHRLIKRDVRTVLTHYEEEVGPDLAARFQQELMRFGSQIRSAPRWRNGMQSLSELTRRLIEAQVEFVWESVLKHSVELELPFGNCRIIDLEALIRAKEAMNRDHARAHSLRADSAVNVNKA